MAANDWAIFPPHFTLRERKIGQFLIRTQHSTQPAAGEYVGTTHTARHRAGKHDTINVVKTSNKEREREVGCFSVRLGVSFKW